jgi:hypothetical protein
MLDCHSGDVFVTANYIACVSFEDVNGESSCCSSFVWIKEGYFKSYPRSICDSPILVVVDNDRSSVTGVTTHS